MSVVVPGLIFLQLVVLTEAQGTYAAKYYRAWPVCYLKNIILATDGVGLAQYQALHVDQRLRIMEAVKVPSKLIHNAYNVTRFPCTGEFHILAQSWMDHAKQSWPIYSSTATHSIASAPEKNRIIFGVQQDPYN